MLKVTAHAGARRPIRGRGVGRRRAAAGSSVPPSERVFSPMLNNVGALGRLSWNLSNPRVLETVRRLVMVGHRAR